MNDDPIDDGSVPEQPPLPAEEAPADGSAVPSQSPLDLVLLIDGDNDPHVPPDVRPTRFTLARVFLRPGAKMPRTLEKKLSRLPHCATVVSPRGGANAADFVMSLHAGMLHATLPHHIPFLMVTNDATLSAMAAELQRLGRIATIWTSHPDAATMAADSHEEASGEPKPRRGRSGGRGRGGRSRSGRAAAPRGGRGRSPRAPLAPAPQTAPPPPDAPRKTGGKTLSEVAWTYAARLQRIKDVPSRLKTLLNDIKNRAGSQGFAPEEVLEELKRHHGVKVDAQGRVQVERIKPASSGTPPPTDAPLS